MSATLWAAVVQPKQDSKDSQRSPTLEHLGWRKGRVGGLVRQRGPQRGSLLRTATLCWGICWAPGSAGGFDWHVGRGEDRGTETWEVEYGACIR